MTDVTMTGGTMTGNDRNRILALAGGVGGAKLADGLAGLIGPRLTVVVNTGDDFEHLGFSICPDLDTVMYTLAGIANPETGWGIAGETWNFIAQVARLGAPDWFRLGDRDLATHAVRTQMLRGGATLSAVTALLCERLRVAATLMPMSDDSVRTIIRTDDGDLPFQDYFVRLHCAVPVRGIRFAGAESAKLNPALAQIENELAAVIICPSNPFLSIDPILAVPGMREWLAGRDVPVIAVSGIVAGAAIKGPAAKIMMELGAPSSAASVAAHYAGLLDGFVIDETDQALAAEIEATGVSVRVAPTIMRNRDDRLALAECCMDFARDLAGRPKP